MGDEAKADIERRTRDIGDGLSLFRQAGGCLEIRQENDDGEDDLVHICDDQEFLATLTAFIRDVPNRGVDS